MSEDFDPYAVLGVADSATRGEVREAYRTLAAKNHPDRAVEQGATELMSSINRAWQIMGDEAGGGDPVRFGFGIRHPIEGDWWMHGRGIPDFAPSTSRTRRPGPPWSS